MGHFYTPPNPFVGGAQPLAPHELPPSLEDVPVNNPPFSHGGRLVSLALIIALAQPGDPFPNQARLGSPALLPVAAATMVPITNEELLAVLAAWQQDQPPQQRRSAFIPGSSVDAPPVITNEELIAVTISWPPQDWPAQKQRQLPPALSAVRVDNPPVVSNEEFWATWESWKFPDPRVQSTRNLPATLLSIAVNNPPVPTPEVFWATYEGWKFPDPRSQSTRNLPPSITAVRVDSPPIPPPELFWSTFEWWKDAAPAIVTARPVPQAPAAPTGQLAPSLTPLAIYAAWQADQPAIQGPRARLIVSVDNPPNTSAAEFWAIWESWKAPDPRSQSSKQSQIVSVDNPPPATNQTEFWNAYASWSIQAPTFWSPRYVIQGASASQPPPAGRPLWLSCVLVAWNPPDASPAQRGPLNPSITNVRVDAPPSIKPGNFGFVYDSWFVPAPIIWSARFTVQGGGIVLTDPLFWIKPLARARSILPARVRKIKPTARVRMITAQRGVVKKFSPTTPAGRPDCTIDFTSILAGAYSPPVTVSSCVVTCAIHPTSAVPDPSASSRCDGGSIVTAGKLVTQFFKNGVPGADYILTFLATLSNGATEPIDAVIQVRAFNDVGT